MTLQQFILPPVRPSTVRPEAEIAELAHDLRNMLSCALLHLEMLQGSVALSGRGRIDKSIAAIERARWTLQQTVDAADHHATPAPYGFDLSDLVTRVASEMSVCGGVEIDVAIEAGLDGWIVSCPARVGRILYNLFINAIAVSGETGRIGVSVASRARGTFQVRVSDQGPGLPVEVRSRFGGHRLPSPSGGGLGLAAAHRMANVLGGSLAVASSGPSGTVIVLTIPDVTSDSGR